MNISHADSNIQEKLNVLNTRIKYIDSLAFEREKLCKNRKKLIESELMKGLVSFNKAAELLKINEISLYHYLEVIGWVSLERDGFLIIQKQNLYEQFISYNISIDGTTSTKELMISEKGLYEISKNLPEWLDIVKSFTPRAT